MNWKDLPDKARISEAYKVYEQIEIWLDIPNAPKIKSDILPAMNGGASHEEEGWRNAVNVV